MLQKKLRMILAFLLSVSMCASCGSGTGGDTTGADASDGADTTANDIPDIDLGGAVVNFLVPLSDQHEIYTSFEIYVETENGERLNDAVFQRNRTISENHNVTIKAEQNLDVVGTARALAMSGDKDFQVYMPYLNPAVALMEEGLISDLHSFDGLNLDKPYWDQNAIEMLDIRGKAYFATGDISIIDDDCTMIMYFNKKLVEDYKMENPYQLVKDHKFTLDKVFEYAEIFNDINGDTKPKQEDDLFGFSTTNAAFFFYGAGQMLATRDDAGNVVVDLEKNVNADLIDKLLGFYHSGNPGFLWTNWEGARDAFAANRLVMFTSVLGNLRLSLYSMKDVEFGLLPLPLADESQEEYRTLISTVLTPVVCIPKHLDAATADTAATACDLVAMYSTDTLRRQYYDIALHDRYFDDTESGEMLDIIYQSRAYDLGWIYNWGGITSVLSGMRNGKNFYSDYASRKEAVNTAIAETVNNIK
ncbi:MAG: hypothetical protein E7632_01110 [Ruminococcaceae bacterium]|nr:hypothetical protein [Oscillospiraceae bacterium]